MAYGFRSNDYGCFGENMLTILNQYLTPEALSGKKCIDLTLGNIEDTVTIFKNMKEVKVEQKMGESELTPLTVRLEVEHISIDFEKTDNGIYVTAIIHNKRNHMKNPKIFIPTLIMFNN